jgi:hypothetical protein
VAIACGAADAQTPPGPPASQGAPTGSAAPGGGVVAGQAPAEVLDCDKPSVEPSKPRQPVSITVNPATRWQPRGGEVIVALQGPKELWVGFAVRACFSWSSASAATYFKSFSDSTEAFVSIRPSDSAGGIDLTTINLGVIVPSLKSAPSGIVERWFSKDHRSAGSGIVPVAGMRLIGYNENGILFDVVRPVGITSLKFSFILTVATVVVGCVVLHRLVVGRGAPAGSSPRPHARSIYGLIADLVDLLKMRWVLRFIRTDDGRASLSAFQIFLWTTVVAASAVYVMALSGNLINITPGTLVLLGIAGAATLVAAGKPSVSGGAAQSGDTKPQAGTNAAPVAATQPPAASSSREPRWADLISDPDGQVDGPDVTRLQMLFFTVVSAVFVLMQVLNTYVIPDIPQGYQILMGISNGIYVGGKFTGSGSRSPSSK